MGNPSAASAVEVMRLIDAALVLPKPEPAPMAKALGIAMPKVTGPAKWEMHEGAFPSGPFEKAELSYRPDLGSGMLVFRARQEPPLLEYELDLARFGKKPGPNPNPQTPPEGSINYGYSFVEGAKKLELSFTSISRKLLTVALRWTPPGVSRNPGH